MKHIVYFVLLNIFIYIVIILFHNKISFKQENYKFNSHHYIQDERINGGRFQLLRALGQYDAQWYLKIASVGYPEKPSNINIEDKNEMDGLSYAFFPLYPLIIKTINYIFKDIELSAFTLSNLLLIINFILFNKFFSGIYKKEIVLKASFLLLFFPFSIFFRSYFTEGIYLTSLLAFSYLLHNKKYLFSGIFLSLLNITKANGFLLNLLFLYLIWNEYRFGNYTLRKIIYCFVIIFLPFTLWIVFNQINAGNALYFLKIRSGWSVLEGIPFGQIFFIFYNFGQALLYPILPFHSFHFSKIDTMTVYLFLTFTVFSQKILKRIDFLIMLSLWLSPLLVTDTMSFTRYQSISYPVFIYLASILKGSKFYLLFFAFYILLLITSLYFVNWWWIG